MTDTVHGPDPLGGPFCRHPQCVQRRPCRTYVTLERDRWAKANAERDTYWAEVFNAEGPESGPAGPDRTPGSSV